MTPKIEKMDMADFEKLLRRLARAGSRSQGTKSWQRSALEAMEPNTAMIVSHDGIACGHAEGGTSCGVRSLARHLRNANPSKHWSTRHLKDGRVAVACFPAEEN
jgi:hypothetical protein